MTNSLFSNGSSNAPQADQAPEGSYYEALVGEGKKYADNELLAKTTWHAQQHIRTLEEENARVRAELEKRANSEEFMNKIMDRLGNQQPSNAPINNGGQDRQEVPAQQDVAQLVKDLYNQEQSRTAQERNRERVVQELHKTWGDDYVNRLKARAKELGESEEFLDQLAATRPQVFLELVKPAAQRTPDNSHVPPRGSGNPANPSINHTGAKTWADYEKIRMTNKDLYWSPDVQRQLQQDAITLGAAFGMPTR